MAGPELTSTLTIIDKSSAVLDAISKSAEQASTQIQSLIDLIDKVGAIKLEIDQSSFDSANASIDNIESRIEEICNTEHELTFHVNQPDIPNPPVPPNPNPPTPPDPNPPVPPVPNPPNPPDNHRDNDNLEQNTSHLGKLLDIGNKLYGTFGLVVGAIDQITSMMESVDKRTQQIARFEQLAKGEGYKGEDVVKRGNQMRKTAFERAQELGVDVTTFNDQLMSFANNSAFTSFEEATEFSTMLNKMFIASGTSADAASGAITQLLQGLSKGKLQGEDLMSILSNAPEVGGLLEKAYARMNNIPYEKVTGKVRDLAGEGKLTADVIKEAILGASDDIESKFKAMPMTFETAMMRIKNSLNEMMQPLYAQLTEFVNSGEYQVFMNSFMKIALSISNIIIPAITFVIKNVSPVLAKAAEVFPYIVDSFISIVDKAKYILIGIGSCIAATWAWNTAVVGVKAVLTAISAHPIMAIAVGAALIIGFIIKMQEESEKFYEKCTKIGLVIMIALDAIGSSIAALFSWIINGVVKFFKFFIGIYSSLLGHVLNKAISGWNWLMDKIGASDLMITSNIGQTIMGFGNEKIDESAFSAKGVIDADGIIGDMFSRVSSASDDFNKTGRELGWKDPNDKKQEDIFNKLDKIERLQSEMSQNTAETAKNTRSVSIDKDSILFMKSMTTAEVINRYNNISDSIAINNHYNSMPSKYRAESNLQAQLQGAQNALRAG